MQRSVAAEPGEPPVTLLNSADVELFVSVTVPAVNWLPLFVVVSENAANVPNAARAPVTPTTTSVARPLRAVVIGFALHGNAPQPGARGKRCLTSSEIWPYGFNPLGWLA